MFQKFRCLWRGGPQAALALSMGALAGCAGSVADGDGEQRGGASGSGGDTVVDDPPIVDENCDVQAAELPAARVWRLTRGQYERGVAALVPGADLTVTKDFVADEKAGEFDNDAGTLRVSAVRAEQFERAARTLGEQAGRRADDLAPCPSGKDRTACRDDFIAAFATRAFRRALAPEEKTGLASVFDEGDKTGGRAAGVGAVVETVLQAPSFLYRTEVGEGDVQDGQIALGGAEVATALAFALTDAPPDKRLLDLGLSGGLADPEVLATEARTLLASERGRIAVTSFIKQWLDLGQLAGIEKSEAGFARFGSTWAPRLEKEVDLLVDDVLRKGRRLNDLLLGSSTFADGELAKLYGAQAPQGTGHGLVQLDDQQRLGVLTTAGFLAVHAIDGASHPIKRGLFVNERLICRIPPPPPEGAATPPPTDPTLSTRERLAKHQEEPLCGNCHSFIDPPGFAFEVFDGLGRYRDEEGGKRIDATGTFAIDKDHDFDFDGPVDFIQKLAPQEAVAACFTRMNHRYFLGAVESKPNGCLLAGVRRRFNDSDRDMSELLVALVTSRAFTHRRPIDLATTQGGQP